MVAAVVVAGLGLTLVAWLVRAELRQRRHARFVAQLSVRYRTNRPALPSASRPQPQETQPSREISVDELVARIRAEGAPSASARTGRHGMAGQDRQRPVSVADIHRRMHDQPADAEQTLPFPPLSGSAPPTLWPPHNQP